MIVLKFGGKSVSTKESIHTICDIVRREMDRHPIVIVSALSTVTDSLLAMVNASEIKQRELLDAIMSHHMSLIDALFSGNIKQDITRYTESCLCEIRQLLQKKIHTHEQQDMLLAYGEILSSYIVCSALNMAHIPAKQILSTKVLITNNQFGFAEPLLLPTRKKLKEKIVPLVRKQVVPVITGFIGRTHDGRTTTLGRGGSDYSASIIGACLDVEEIQFWKDVHGIYSSDPRKEKDAKLLKVLTHQQAHTLATAGIKILHPRAIVPIMLSGIPVRVRNTFSPDHPGTLITSKGGLAL